MIINYKNKEGKNSIAIAISGCTAYEDIKCLQNALIEAIECMALHKDECESEDIWCLADLLKDTFLTTEQSANVKI